MKSRMTGDCHVRFCERLGVKLPRPTRRVCVKEGGRDTYLRLCKQINKNAAWLIRAAFLFIVELISLCKKPVRPGRLIPVSSFPEAG